MLLLLPKETKEQFPPLSPVWLDAGDNGKEKGPEWSEQN
jgi:hypothetical protein